MKEKQYKNYLEHDECVRAIDGIFSHSQDWQWFTETIVNNFDLNDVNSWQSFQDKGRILSEVYKLFIQIIRVYNFETVTNNDLLNDVIYAAEYWNGKTDWQSFTGKVRTAFGQAFLLIVWLAKLVNVDNNTEYIYDYGMLNTKNYWQLVKIDTVIENKDAIEAYTRKIGFPDLEQPATCLYDNLNKREYA